MSTNAPMTVTYDTREESNQNLGIGLGCNGVIDVLIEPINHDSNNPVDKFKEIISINEPVSIATVFSSTDINLIGKKIIIPSAVETNDPVTNAVKEDLEMLFETKKSEARTYRTDTIVFDAFIELIQPTVSLIIFGGGFDARPVSHLAKSLGWDVTVTDECVAHIAPIFFPTADNLSLCQRQFIDRDFSITPYTACVLMSHNYEYDRDVLKKLLQTETPYIGILGPKKRFDKMLDEFAKENIMLMTEDHHRIHSPIGLDIGAEAPDEIAISIIAEIQSKFSNRSGGFLKYRSGPIHHRDSASDQVFKQVYISSHSKKSSSGF
jgi:xanthine/CO dehydrogenase XdhC/CoxF family maturation factor